MHRWHLILDLLLIPNQVMVCWILDVKRKAAVRAFKIVPRYILKVYYSTTHIMETIDSSVSEVLTSSLFPFLFGPSESDLKGLLNQ